MSWFSLTNSGFQFLFLFQQLFLIGHETTTFYVLKSGRQLLPVSLKVFFWNIFMFLWNGKYSVKLGQKGYKMYQSYQKSLLSLSSSSKLFQPITTDEFLNEPFREKIIEVQSSCCSGHHHNRSCNNDIERGEFESSRHLITNDRMER